MKTLKKIGALILLVIVAYILVGAISFCISSSFWAGVVWFSQLLLLCAAGLAGLFLVGLIFALLDYIKND